jgi:hypothetical protein
MFSRTTLQYRLSLAAFIPSRTLTASRQYSLATKGNISDVVTRTQLFYVYTRAEILGTSYTGGSLRVKIADVWVCYRRIIDEMNPSQ